MMFTVHLGLKKFVYLFCIINNYKYIYVYIIIIIIIIIISF